MFIGQLSMAIICQIFILFFVKVIDNMISTSKQLLIQKNKAFLASITAIISQILFYKLISVVATDKGNLALFTISIASGVGTYLGIVVNNKISKERVYINVIMSDDKDAMVELRDYLVQNRITSLATDGYTKDWKKTIAITAYAKTKEESKLLDKYIEESETKFKRVITKA